METTERKVIYWLFNGEAGESSKSMAYVLLGKKIKYAAFPHDPSDFRRCLLMLDKIPEFKDKLNVMAAQSETWDKLINNWDSITSVFLTECDADNEYMFHRAPKTYELMKQVMK